MKKIAALLSIALAVLIGGASAQADELKVLSGGVMRPALPEIASGFERMTGVKVAITYDAARTVKSRVQKGEAVDVVILPKPDLAALVKMRKIAADSVQVIAQTPLALAVKKGMAKPDIASADAVKKALLEAKSIAYNDPSKGFADGVLARRVVNQLRIAKQVKANVKLLKTIEEIRGEKDADIRIGWAPTIMASSDYDLVGPLPAQFQDTARSTWAAGAATKSADPNGARDLVRVLAAPIAGGTFKAKGMAPPT